MSAITVTTTLTNGHKNGKLENGLKGYRKNGYTKQESMDSAVSTYKNNRL